MEEAKVRLILDTSQAKAELAGFLKESQRTESRVSGNLRQSLRSGLNMIGAGAAFGTGLAAVRGATQSGIGDVVGEALGGYGSQVAEFFLGDLDENAKAAKAAREETIQAFGSIAGATNRVPPGAKNFFDQIKSLRVQEERGRELFERDERFRGPGVGQLVDRIMAGIGELLSQAVDKLASKLNPWNWFA